MSVGISFSALAESLPGGYIFDADWCIMACIGVFTELPFPSSIKQDGWHEDGRFGAHAFFGLFHSSMRQEGRADETRIRNSREKYPCTFKTKKCLATIPSKTTLGRPILVGWLIEWMAGWHSLVSMHSMDSMDSNPWLPWIS